MRASFLLVLALALLVGLGVAVAVSSLGLLKPQVVTAPTTTPPPAPPPAPPPPPPRPSILVAARPLFSGDTIRATDVRVRQLRPEEMAEYEKAKAEYLPPVAESALYRTVISEMAADTPFLKKSLNDLTKPESLNARIVPGMRAVNVSIPKLASTSSLIQVGDWVDVYITTEVGRSDQTGRTMQTGVLVHHAQVIAKRETLFSGFVTPPANEVQIQYTLAVNTYRAALLEFGRTVGIFSMAPVSEPEKKQLDELKKTALTDTSKIALFTYSDPNSTDFKAEDQRIKEVQEGKQSVGADDLIRVLNLKPIPAPVPPPAPPAPRVKTPPPPPVTVELLTGTAKSGLVEFPVQAPPPEPEPAPPAPPTPPQGRYFFVQPKAAMPSTEPSTAGTAPQAIPAVPR